jgi:ATP-dependent DNA helicase DinG
VDIFRAEEDACLLGTDAIRDGVDVPGRSLRLLVFDRIPWPRPTSCTRPGAPLRRQDLRRRHRPRPHRPGLRPADPPRRRQGRLRHARRQLPHRLFSGLPAGVELQRVTLVEAIEQVAEFLAAAPT